MKSRELLNDIQQIPLWGNICPAFSTEVKRRVRDSQNHQCAICGDLVPLMQIHHRVPEKALLRQGIKGRDVEKNAVALCSGENGRGEGSEDDCHELADVMAIRNHMFFVGNKFVPLSEVPTDLYMQFQSKRRQKRESRERNRRNRYRHHR